MSIFTEITILVCVAAAISVLMHLLRQPLIVGYIVTGLLVGPLFFDLVKSTETLALFSQIGVAFLLFIVGLNLTPKIIREFGKVAVVTGLGQLAFTSLAGYFVCRALGFPTGVSLYLAIALAFSSTIIVLKLLSDRGDLEKLYARVAIGFLLVQDLAAVLLLFILPLASSREAYPLLTAAVIIRAIVLVVVVYLLSYYLLPKLNRVLARSQELLFLFSIAWGFGLAALFHSVGFSLETGALTAGVMLATLPSHHEIHARMKPLRDFFIVLFFILLGAQINFADLTGLLRPALLLSLFVLIGNPLLMLIVLGLMGFRKKTGFQAGLTVAQVSEFSLIIVALGINLGHLPPRTLSLITIIGLVTIFGSTYLIAYSDKIYRRLAGFLSLFERRGAREKALGESAPEQVLFGFDRIGYDFLETFKRNKKSLLVVDYNPQVTETLAAAQIPNIYGDAGDAEFLRLLNFKKTALAVSTIPDYETNLLIFREVRRQNPKAQVWAVSHNVREAMALYRKGLHYVILPHFLGGKYSSLLVERHGFNTSAFLAMRKRHIRYLEGRLAAGHEHPLHEKARL